MIITIYDNFARKKDAGMIGTDPRK